MFKKAQRRIQTLEAMLRCSEEWTQYWEREAMRAAASEERYKIPVPHSLKAKP